jgi:hypothetical protein
MNGVLLKTLVGISFSSKQGRFHRQSEYQL